jgi:phage tail-like protein
VDTGLAGGIYYYYTLFIGDEPLVKPFSRASAMATQCYGFADRLYRLLPEVHRTYDEPSPSGRGQGPLRKFLEIFGAALDYYRSRAEDLRGRHDVLQAPADLLPHLAQWIGWDLDLTQDEISQRMEILFAPELYRTVGTLPNIQALVNRVTGWDCRIKEFVHNVCLSNAPETLHLWDIWEMSRNDAGNAWLTPVQCTMAENYDGRPSCVKDAGGKTWLFWHSGRSGGRGIWCQSLDVNGAAPRRIELCPQDDPDGLLQSAGSPSVILVGEELWLFCESGQPGKREVWWTEGLSPNKAAPFPARNLSLHPADDSNPAAVRFGRNQVWVFWQSNRRGPTDIWARVHAGGQWGPPRRITTAGLRHWAPAAVVYNNILWLFYCEDYYSEQGISCRLRCRTFGGHKWSEKEDAVTSGPHDESPAAVVWGNEIWLFWHVRDAQGHWQIRGKTFNGSKWERSVQVTDHPAADKEPAALVDSDGRLRVFWRSQRRGSFRIKGQSQGLGYPLQSCTVDTRNTGMLAHVCLQKEAFENGVHYTYDTRAHDTGKTGINSDAWCARDTVGVYLTPDTLDAELITHGQELVKGLIQRFLPIQTRIVFIIEPPVVMEKFYTYDFPDDTPQTLIEEQYGDELERDEQYDGPVEVYEDTLPDWIWLRAWGESCHEHRSVDFKAVPIVTRYRTWQAGLKSGG